eukprot:10952503-Ditylum_brightwellii.AAC.1
MSLLKVVLSEEKEAIKQLSESKRAALGQQKIIQETQQGCKPLWKVLPGEISPDKNSPISQR